MSNKVKKIEQREPAITEAQVKEHWEECMGGFKILLNSQIEKCSRIDFVFDMKNAWVTVNPELDVPELDYFYGIANLAAETYGKVLEIASGMSFDDYKEPLKRDLLTGPVMSDEPVKTWAEGYEEIMCWEFIRPYGEKLEQMNQLVMDQMKGVALEQAEE